MLIYTFSHCFSFHLSVSELEKKFSYENAVTVKHKEASPSTLVLPRSKSKYRANKEADNSKVWPTDGLTD